MYGFSLIEQDNIAQSFILYLKVSHSWCQGSCTLENSTWLSKQDLNNPISSWLANVDGEISWDLTSR